MKQIATLLITLVCCSIGTIVQSWPAVAPVDLNRLKPSDFSDNELEMPFYLKHFHKVANSVVETGPDKGFINIHVWRNKEGQQTFNARIMESILSLAYFYCTDRPWNVYRGDPALRVRLEAALDFWCRIQNKDGQFSEYAPLKWNLPATAFGTKFMGETLILLKSGPPIDQQLLARVTEADRKAIMVVLTDTALYAHGKNYSNQFTNVWAGALAYMSLCPDAAIHQRMVERIEQSATDFQSPAGFFYEAGATDFGYNFNTHHSNLWMAYHFSRNTPVANYFIEEEKRYYDWIAYNAVPEPAGYFTTNRGIETRQKAPVVSSFFTLVPLGEAVPGIRAFNASKEEKQLKIDSTRKALVQSWPKVPELGVGEFSSFSPYAFLHKRNYQWNPTNLQKKAAFGELPYIKDTNFIHQKMDSRRPTVFTFVRRPSYYASFNSGPVIKDQQRYGIGLLWHPAVGTLLQSQTGTDSAAWGTKDGQKLYEADSMRAVFLINRRMVVPKPGNHDYGPGSLTATYTLGYKGMKRIAFEDDRIIVTVDHEGSFTEYLPLLLNKNDHITVVKEGEVVLEKAGIPVRILFNAAAKPVIRETRIISGSQRVVVLTLEARDQLKYTLMLPAARVMEYPF